MLHTVLCTPQWLPGHQPGSGWAREELQDCTAEISEGPPSRAKWMNQVISDSVHLLLLSDQLENNMDFISLSSCLHSSFKQKQEFFLTADETKPASSQVSYFSPLEISPCVESWPGRVFDVHQVGWVNQLAGVGGRTGFMWLQVEAGIWDWGSVLSPLADFTHLGEHIYSLSTPAKEEDHAPLLLLLPFSVGAGIISCCAYIF